MKLTKFSHACVLVEDSEHVVLFDPGQFAWESGLVDLEQIERLDYVLITHEHFDHFFESFVRALIERFPEAHFLSTPEVVAQLTEFGAKHISTESDQNVKVTELAHDGMAPLSEAPVPQNVRFDYKDIITHPGDSIHFGDSSPILFLPLAGPWESAIEAIAAGQSAEPKFIVPIHDWMWNDEWRQSMYDRLSVFYPSQGTEFIQPINGQPFEIDL